MKLPSDPRFPLPNDKTKELTQRLYDVHREIARTVNGSAMWDTEGTAAPTTGVWSDGNTVRNSAPSEAGTAGSKYIVIGWMYVSGAWMPMRVLTGN